MRAGELEYVYVLCAVLYVLAIGVGAVGAERALTAPVVYRHSRITETQFRSGDVLMWVAPSSFNDDFVKLVCQNKITHVGMVFVDKSGVPFTWESLYTGHSVVPLLPCLTRRTAKGHVCMLRKITRPLDSKLFEQFIRDNLNKPYSFTAWRAILRRVFKVLNVPAGFSDVEGEARYCSQLVAETFESLGVLDFRNCVKPASLILPADFSEEVTQELPWVAPYSLGPPIRLDV